MAEVPIQQQRGQPLKYTVTHNRKPQHTHETFIKWLTEEHLPLAMLVMKKHGVLGYSLFVTPPSLSDALRQEMAKFRPSWDVAEFDCFIEYTIPDMQTIQNVITDPEWVIAIKDQDDLVDMDKALVSLGYSTAYLLETGDVINMQK